MCFLLKFIYCRCGNKRFDVLFWRIKLVYFLTKDGDYATCAEENGGKMFISRQSRHFLFVDITIRVLFPILYLDLACKPIMFPARKRVYIKETKVLKKDPYYCFFKLLTVLFVTSYSFKITFSAILPGWLKKKNKLFQSSLLLSIFPFKKMSTLRENRKLAAVARETQEEHPRSGQSRNTSIPRIEE